jgi:hypothetical protein
MRLKEFEGKYLRLHINVKVVKAYKVFWVGGRTVSVWYLEEGKRKVGKIFLPFGSGKNVGTVKKALKEFVIQGGDKCQ